MSGVPPTMSPSSLPSSLSILRAVTLRDIHWSMVSCSVATSFISDSKDWRAPAAAILECCISASEDPVPTEDPVRAEDAVAIEDAVRAEDAVATEDAVRAEDAVATEDAVRAENGVPTEDPVRAEDAVRAEDGVATGDGVAAEDGESAAEDGVPAGRRKR